MAFTTTISYSHNTRITPHSRPSFAQQLLSIAALAPASSSPSISVLPRRYHSLHLFTRREHLARLVCRPDIGEVVMSHRLGRGQPLGEVVPVFVTAELVSIMDSDAYAMLPLVYLLEQPSEQIDRLV